MNDCFHTFVQLKTGSTRIINSPVKSFSGFANDSLQKEKCFEWLQAKRECSQITVNQECTASQEVTIFDARDLSVHSSDSGHDWLEGF